MRPHFLAPLALASCLNPSTDLSTTDASSTSTSTDTPTTTASSSSTSEPSSTTSTPPCDDDPACGPDESLSLIHISEPTRPY